MFKLSVSILDIRFPIKRYDFRQDLHKLDPKFEVFVYSRGLKRSLGKAPETNEPTASPFSSWLTQSTSTEVPLEIDFLGVSTALRTMLVTVGYVRGTYSMVALLGKRISQERHLSRGYNYSPVSTTVPPNQCDTRIFFSSHAQSVSAHLAGQLALFLDGKSPATRRTVRHQDVNKSARSSVLLIIDENASVHHSCIVRIYK